MFDGLDTSLAGAYRLLGLTAPRWRGRSAGGDCTPGACGARRVLVDGPVGRGAGARARSCGRPSRASGLSDPDIADLLDVKEQQFVDALVAALGLQISAIAQPAGLSDPDGTVCRLCAAADAGRRHARPGRGRARGRRGARPSPRDGLVGDRASARQTFVSSSNAQPESSGPSNRWPRVPASSCRPMRPRRARTFRGPRSARRATPWSIPTALGPSRVATAGLHGPRRV